MLQESEIFWENGTTGHICPRRDVLFIFVDSLSTQRSKVVLYDASMIVQARGLSAGDYGCRVSIHCV